MTNARLTPGRRCAIAMIRFYQRFISPLLPPTCRYSPTCSEYAAQAIQRFGVFRGIWLGMKRLVRCHPWSSSGYDPVPEFLPSSPIKNGRISAKSSENQ